MSLLNSFIFELNRFKGCIIHGNGVPYFHNKCIGDVRCHWCGRKYVYFWRLRGLLYSIYYFSIKAYIKDYLEHRGK